MNLWMNTWRDQNLLSSCGDLGPWVMETKTRVSLTCSLFLVLFLFPIPFFSVLRFLVSIIQLLCCWESCQLQKLTTNNSFWYWVPFFLLGFSIMHHVYQLRTDFFFSTFKPYYLCFLRLVLETWNIYYWFCLAISRYIIIGWVGSSLSVSIVCIEEGKHCIPVIVEFQMSYWCVKQVYVFNSCELTGENCTFLAARPTWADACKW